MGHIDEDEELPFEDEEFPFEDGDLFEDSELSDFDLSDDEGFGNSSFGSSSFGSSGFGGSPFGVETCKFDNKTALIALSVGFVAFVLGYITGKVS